MEKEIKLKRCPFCNGEGKAAELYDYDIKSIPIRDYDTLYGCNECDVWRDTPEQWNTRYIEKDKFQEWADCWGMIIFIVGGLFWLILFFLVRG